jgi:protocatechuate 3,4-dioxygenase, beta subunit
MKKYPLLWAFFPLCIICVFMQSCMGQNSEKSNSVQPKNQQGKTVGGMCDGCGIMYEGMPDLINETDTSDGWNEAGQKLIVTGTVFQLDGKTPAPDIILYYWQTDNSGRYTLKQGMNEKASRHGHLRGWVKTDNQGKYRIYTIRPAAYPGERIPQHIHFIVKEPNIKNEYYIDDLYFDDDPFLIEAERKKLPQRGGNGIVKVEKNGTTELAKFNITLGMNIPDYPKK